MEKTGIKTTEFWLMLLATVLPAVIGLFAVESVVYKIIAAGIAVLAALGYTAGRSLVKANAIKAKAIADMAATNPTPGS